MLPGQSGLVPVEGTTRMVETLFDGQQRHYDSFEINQYPEQARREITRRDLKDAVEEMTGCKIHIKGRYFTPGEPNMLNERKLYVEIAGPTVTAVIAAKKHVRDTMEQNAIRTLNLGPGFQHLQGGMGKRWDPRAGGMI